MAVLSPKASYRDISIGTVLAFMLGLGVLFISLYKGYATAAYSILFGEILGISSGDVLLTLVAGLVILGAVAIVYRPLLFASLDEDVAEAPERLTACGDDRDVEQRVAGLAGRHVGEHGADRQQDVVQAV